MTCVSGRKTVSCITLLSSVFVLAVGLCLAADTGYDENTEVLVKGKIQHLDTKTCKGLQSFLLNSRGRAYIVLTGPAWFVREIGLNVPVGADVEVIGSKFYGRDGSLYLLARSIRFLPDGYTVLLRDRSCKPVWNKSGRNQSSSCMKIFYHSPQ